VIGRVGGDGGAECDLKANDAIVAPTPSTRPDNTPSRKFWHFMEVSVGSKNSSSSVWPWFRLYRAPRTKYTARPCY